MLEPTEDEPLLAQVAAADKRTWAHWLHTTLWQPLFDLVGAARQLLPFGVAPDRPDDDPEAQPQASPES